MTKAELDYFFEKGDALSNGNEEYLPHVKMALAPNGRDAEAEQAAALATEIITLHALQLVSFEVVSHEVLPHSPTEYPAGYHQLGTTWRGNVSRRAGVPGTYGTRSHEGSAFVQKGATKSSLASIAI